MFKWSAFPFIRVTLSLVLGILLYDRFPQLWDIQAMVLLPGLACLLMIWWIRKHSLMFGGINLLFIVYLGGTLARLNDEPLKAHHYSNHPRAQGFVGTVISDHSVNSNYLRYNLLLQAARIDTADVPLDGQIHLYIRKTEHPSPLNYGDVVTVMGSYFSVSPPANPHEFDYQNYLKRQNIFAQAFVAPSGVRKIDYDPPNRIRALAFRIRAYTQAQLDAYISYEREHAILTALLLGIKDHLDDETQSAYAAAGAMHVLAVSGLHVGIIYMVLVFLFKSIKEKRWGRLLYLFVSHAVIWIYALVTGFSPSVMRAATMFSVVILSEAFNRKANIYNSLGVAACILIVYDPNMIYSVGFQLSFAAVFGIVKIQPILYRLIEVDNKLVDYVWSISCVSIAAQLATFPLTLLYFHQFPTYFLISNLIVIPAATIFLGAGIIMLVLGSILPIVGKTIGFYFQEAVWLVNEFIAYLERLPYPVFDGLYFDGFDTVLIYLILIFLLVGLSKYSFSNLSLSACLLMIWFGWLNYKDYQQQHTRKIIFYTTRDAVAIDLIDGKQATLLVGELHPDEISYRINPNRLASGLPSGQETFQVLNESEMVYQHPACDVIGWQDFRILIIKSGAEEYEWKHSISADILFLDEPVLPDLEKLHADQLILGGNIGYYDTQKILRSCKGKIDVHSLSQDGFWELDLNQIKKPDNGFRTLFSKR